MTKSTDGLVRLIPEMAAVFHIVRGDAYSSNTRLFWMRWGWCKASDVLQLINREYNLKWNRRDLLTRFALDWDEIKGSRYAASKPPMAVLMEGDKGPYTFSYYRCGLLSDMEKSEADFYVPSGWVKDVLWAMYGGFTRFSVKEIKEGKYAKVVGACQEDGTPVYYV